MVWLNDFKELSKSKDISASESTLPYEQITKYPSFK